MKKVILTMLIGIVSLCVIAQTKEAAKEKKEVKAPSAVLKAFQQKFPTAVKVSWGKENAKEWEAEFTFKEGKLSANFLEDGTWVETEKEIPVSELPKAVSDAIQKQYPNWKITEADKTETAKNGLIYEADIKSGKQKKEVAFKEDGTPVKE